MDFREALLAAAAAYPRVLGKKQKATLKKLREKPQARFSRFWAAAAAMAAHRYERQTGRKLPAEIDWATILDWLVTNLPKILLVLASLLVFI